MTTPTQLCGSSPDTAGTVPAPTSFFADLREPYALVFAGQGSAWKTHLAEGVALPHAGTSVRTWLRHARSLLAPVALELETSANGASERLDAILDGDIAPDPLDENPAVSVPGIVLAQICALIDLEATSLDIHNRPPQVVLGHSQGILGAEVARAWLEGNEGDLEALLALAILIGHAAHAATHRAGLMRVEEATPMLSVRGVPPLDPECTTSDLAAVRGRWNIAVVNGANTTVYAGDPLALRALRRHVEDAADARKRRLDAHHMGGSLPEIDVAFLPVGAPFHSPLLAGAVDLVAEWVSRLGATDATRGEAALEPRRARELAEAILTHPTDWPADVAHARDAGVNVFLDLGPTNLVTKLSGDLLAGTGALMIDASTPAARIALDDPAGPHPQATSWEKFAPRLVRLGDGRTVVDTAFTRLTGRSPIMLAAMTPTTVDPEIVAAAANAGLWAEMAGGGQYSEEIFRTNSEGLKKLLAPGRAAGFNTMFFDRFMWNLQFGVNRIVPKARVNGAPFDAVTISAGVPEKDEAVQLIRQLSAEGFTSICFKPGTIEQITDVLAIAEAVPDRTIIMQIEDGHAGGHHSWEDLDDLLLATYAQIRQTPNLVVTVGGGIGTPQRAADYLTGTWARAHGRPAMPVHGVLVGTAAMTVAEAKTSPQVKRLLMETPGIESGWVGREESSGGVTSGLSHLDADMYEVDNSSAAASRLIHEIGPDTEAIARRRDEIIAALDKTAKPYFGDVETMTYAQWARRAVALAYPYADWTWADRILDLLRRIEARLNEADHGEIPTLFADLGAVADPEDAVARLLAAYPQAESTRVSPQDAAWFITLCRKHHKPLPFVPVLDADLARWWGTDTLWQSHDSRFDADAVRIIPGPISVGGIDRIDEPVGDMFARYENAVVDAIRGGAGAESSIHTDDRDVFSRLGDAHSVEEFLRLTPHVEWNGNLVANPLVAVPGSTLAEDEDGWSIHVECDTAPGLDHAVRDIVIPIAVPESCADGGYPVVDMARLSRTAFDLLAGAAGVGSTTVTGDRIDAMPQVADGEGWGVVTGEFTYTSALGEAHAEVTGAALGTRLAPLVADAWVGPCWPTIYAALGTATFGGYPVIEGLINAVHLDHTVTIVGALPQPGTRVATRGRCVAVSESHAGRVVHVDVELRANGELFTHLVERFAIRGRVTSSQAPEPAPDFTGGADIVDVPRALLRQVTVTAPADMTAFATVSGDFNPIHTSYAAAALSGLQAPLVHGMWLSAVAQHVVSAPALSSTAPVAAQGAPMEIRGWSYRMFGMVNLLDDVDVSVERVGRTRVGDLVIEVTCRVDDTVVSIGRALVAAPRTAYVYPGQGIQRAGMGMDAMTSVTRAVFARADAHTRATLGFSIEAIIRDNPTQIRIGSRVVRHPDGVLNLTQFTQVALATLAYAQTEQLRAEGAFVEGAMYAGHSLGEYNALAACAKIFPFEQVLEIVYARGSAMHDLVERDAEGRSNYRMGALRPNECGIGEDEVRSYIEALREETGEFLQIVNENLAGAQYAIAGTVRGLELLAKDASARADARGGRRPFMLIPGIDVPFHSSVLRAGVVPFREKLRELLPEVVDTSVLVGRYVPNLVARPFELTEDFARAIVDVVPSGPVLDLLERGWSLAMEEPSQVARTLLIELLAWQFASPVRWIETQDLLLGAEYGVDRLVEVGLATAPTLANLAEKTLRLPRFAGEVRIHRPEILNVERDAARVRDEDVPVALAPTDTADDAPAAAASSTDARVQADSLASGDSTSTAGMEAVGETSPAPAPVSRAAAVPELPLSASEAVAVLLAWSTKMTRDQIDDADTVDTLTAGVSSKRNQLLMDMAAELGVPTIEGAAEATIADLSAKVDQVAAHYQPFGPVLAEATGACVRKLAGAAGAKPTVIEDRLASAWALPASWNAQVKAEILLGTREGDSVRGGTLAAFDVPTGAGGLDALVDAAAQAVAARHGVSISQSRGGGEGSMVDSAALRELREAILGPDGVLATQARDLLTTLGVSAPAAAVPDNDSDLADAVMKELGPNWVRALTPAFDERRCVLLDDRWASAREDLARVASGDQAAGDVEIDLLRGAGASLCDLADWYATHCCGEGDDAVTRRRFFDDVARAAMEEPTGAFVGEVALVTGAAPGSIAASLVARLLAGGATVIQTASRITHDRLEFAKGLYARHGAIGSRLWLVPANLASLRDVDALIDWIGRQQTRTVGATTTIVKPALLPTLFFPFAAPPVRGGLGEDMHEAMLEERLLVWSIERSISRLADLGRDWATGHRVHVVLPGSPNRGTFGGDGAYGEAKSALCAIANKWRVERRWADRVTLAHPSIGWVRGTNLMGHNDALIPAAAAAGITVFTPDEVADRLLDLCTLQARRDATEAVLTADLTGGLASTPLDFAALAQATAEQGSTDQPAPAATLPVKDTTIGALPNLPVPRIAAPVAWPDVTTPLRDLVVIVGIGEVGTWGSGRTRHDVENSAGFELTAAGVMEMAWMMGLIHFSDTPAPGWYDANADPVAESGIYERFHDEVIARSGIRPLSDDSTIVEAGSNDVVTVYLPSDQTFAAAGEADARAYRDADPTHTEIWCDAADGQWMVRKRAGAPVRVPRRATLSRSVGGQIPDGFDPAHWGIPATMRQSLDRIAVWNLVTAVDAFTSAGFSPAELLRGVHPADVSSTQGTGIGGMESLRKVFVDRFLGEDRPQDILQEALPNVVAAHTMQSYVGGYGQMIHPVGACATAAVSIEEGVDKIRLGKARVVVAGGIDDISVESLTGFGDMNATANTQEMLDQGIEPRYISRAGDRRRAGFLEAEGGGTVILARADVAADLGLPVLGVVAYAQSFADGAHTSIPAPGIGALAAARGGRESSLARGLSSVGLTIDDVAVVSKHDTSTNANDPNEAELHARICAALGREAGNPLYVISQKTLTGHAKGGAAVFQIAGLCDLMRTQTIPANRSVDCVDPQMAAHTPLVWLRHRLSMGHHPVRAAVLTSLGFGHVSALVALAHPRAFEAALAHERGAESARSWRDRAEERLVRGQAHRQAAMCGHAQLFEPIDHRRLPEETSATGDSHETEVAMLLDPQARLDASGVFAASSRAGAAGE